MLDRRRTGAAARRDRPDRPGRRFPIGHRISAPMPSSSPCSTAMRGGPRDDPLWPRRTRRRVPQRAAAEQDACSQVEAVSAGSWRSPTSRRGRLRRSRQWRQSRRRGVDDDRLRAPPARGTERAAAPARPAAGGLWSVRRHRLGRDRSSAAEQGAARPPRCSPRRARRCWWSNAGAGATTPIPVIAIICAITATFRTATTPARRSRAIRASSSIRSASNISSRRTRPAISRWPRPSAAARWSMACRRGASIRSISAWPRPMACPMARRWPTGRSTTTIWRPGTTAPNGRSALPGRRAAIPMAVRAARDFPMPPVPGYGSHAVLKRGADALGLKTFTPPLALNTVPRDGRGACIQCGSCVGFPCPSDAKNGTQNTVLRRALETGNLTLVTGVVVRAHRDRRCRQGDRRRPHPRRRPRAKPSAPRPWSLRLRRSRRHGCCLLRPRRESPNGLGNRSDHLGRHLQGHQYPGALGLFDEEVVDLARPGRRPSPRPTTITAIPASSAVACWPTISS